VAHIHLEDGSFTLFWVIIWWSCALVFIGIALYMLRSKNKPDPRKITIAAFLTAASFATFQVSIPVFGGVHINLTPLIGILAGPFFGALIVFIVNILTAAIGHGGWGLIGANVVVNLTEVIVAFGVYRGLKRVTRSLFSRAGVATFTGLLCGNIVMIAIILLSGVQGATQSTSMTLIGLTYLAAINMGVAVIEAIITGLIAAYIGKARPDLLGRDR
jgi:cobalt/nickel transport system permease protein